MSTEKLFKSVINQTIPKIIGLARNYGKNKTSEPVIFTKTFNSITQAKTIQLDKNTEINHELELGLIIQKSGKNIKQKQAEEYIGGYFLCFDLTERNLMTSLRNNQYSWELCKGQDNFLPVGDFIDKSKIGNPMNVYLNFFINEQEKYCENTSGMCYNIYEQIEYISQYMTLNEGDLILTGTPNIGPINKTEKIKGKLLNSQKQILSQLEVQIF